MSDAVVMHVGAQVSVLGRDLHVALADVGA
jgi:hypothetical protein